MSGPKIVRVVTREELIETCATLLRQLDRTIALWEAEGQRLGQLTASDVSATKARREALQALLASDRFVELQKRVPDEIGFLSRDLAQQQHRAVEAAAHAMQVQRQRRENANTLLKALQSKSPTPPAELMAALEQLSTGETPRQDGDSILAKGFMLLSAPGEKSGVTAAQRALASRLAEGEAGRAFADWKAQQGHRQDDRLHAIDRRLSELRICVGEQAALCFMDRLSAIDAGPPGPSTNMRIDALVLDLAAAVQAAQQEAHALQDAQTILAELSASAEDATQKLRNSLEAAVATKDFASLPTLLEAGRAALEKNRKSRAAAARRAAILRGLSALGYEVREGMSTAWVQNGRVVLGKRSTPGYGVELASAFDAERLQVRAVAFSADRDTKRDRDIETIWCGEFGKLQDLLSKDGSTLAIERALPTGASPLKAVEGPSAEGHPMRETKVSGRNGGE